MISASAARARRSLANRSASNVHPVPVERHPLPSRSTAPSTASSFISDSSRPRRTPVAAGTAAHTPAAIGFLPDGRFVTGVPHDPERKLEIVRLVLHYEDLRHAALPIRLGARRAAGPV